MDRGGVQHPRRSSVRPAVAQLGESVENRAGVSMFDEVITLVPIGIGGVLLDDLHDLPAPAREALGTTAALYERRGFRPPWIGYLAATQARACVGTCAFTGPPRGERVEIAYFTFPGYEGRGYATRMAQLLIAVARVMAPQIQVAAQTLPEENVSTRILARLGFQRSGSSLHPEDGLVWDWNLASGTLPQR
jgi:[ribosomal protein S5]-alanine N-acetyltransferase